jgi:microcompartment protein CcmK/EutM
MPRQDAFMNLGKVVGTVVATRKEASMDGLKFMLVKHVDAEARETGGQVVAVDAIGVGPGELVLVATGSSARQTLATQNRPCDAVIMAIVDSWEIGGVDKYKK